MTSDAHVTLKAEAILRLEPDMALETLIFCPCGWYPEFPGAKKEHSVILAVSQSVPCIKNREVQKTIRSGRIPSLIVDEANVALPGLR